MPNDATQQMTDRDSQSIEFLVPYFGSRALLEIAVCSVIEQEDHRWSLRVVQDGPDVVDVGPWLAGLKDHRITYHRNHRNLGTAGNFQRCLDLATGSHVVFLGCDDVLLPTYVSVVLGAFERHPDAAVIQPGVAVIDHAGRHVLPLADRVKRAIGARSETEVCLGGEALAASLVRGNWLYFPSLCWRRDLTVKHGFRQDLPVTLDLALLSQVLLDDGKLVVTPEAAFRYRRHAASLSSASAHEVHRFEEEARLFKELAEDFGRAGWRRAARAARGHLMSRLHAVMRVPGAVARRDRSATRRLIRHAVLS